MDTLEKDYLDSYQIQMLDFNNNATIQIKEEDKVEMIKET